MSKIYTNISEDCYIFVPETGEIVGTIGAGSKVSVLSEKEQQAVRFKKAKNEAIRGNITCMGEYTIHYRDGYKLLNGVSFETSGALLLLSQYIIQNRIEDGFILLGTQGGGYVKPFKTKAKIARVLEFKNKSTIYTIIDEAIEAGLLRHSTDGFRLNEKLFFKGSASKGPFIVSFKRSITNLFYQEKLPIKTIGYLFKISEYLPLTDVVGDYTLLKNPGETNPSNMQYLTIEGLAERLGVSVKTIKRLSDIRITFSGFENYGKLPLIIKFGQIGSSINHQGLILNPLIFTYKLNEAIEKGLIKFKQVINS